MVTLTFKEGDVVYFETMEKAMKYKSRYAKAGGDWKHMVTNNVPTIGSKCLQELEELQEKNEVARFKAPEEK